MTAKAKAHSCGPRPDLKYGQRVTVREPGLYSWLGTVTAVKPARWFWRVEVRRADGMTWSLPAYMVSPEGGVA